MHTDLEKQLDIKKKMTSLEVEIELLKKEKKENRRKLLSSKNKGFWTSFLAGCSSIYIVINAIDIISMIIQKQNIVAISIFAVSQVAIAVAYYFLFIKDFKNILRGYKSP